MEKVRPVFLRFSMRCVRLLESQRISTKKDNADFKKTPMDDFINMKQGLEGYKGHIHFHFCGAIDNEVVSLNGSRNEQITETAKIIDKKIHANYRIFKNNMIAYDMLLNTNKYAQLYTEEEKNAFEAYLQKRIELIDLEQKDIAFLKQKLLEMYANILINKEKCELQ